MKLFTRYLFSLVLLFLTGITASAQLTAGFTASPIAGCAPLVVCYTNTTTPSSGTTYDWDLGNGTGIIHLLNPCGSYLTPGTYTCTLTAHNGSLTSTHTQTITVYPPPVVNFVADDTAVCPGTPVTFTSTTVGGVPGAITYAWAFGDGGPGTGSPVTHTYTTSGYKNVTLTATNADGCVASLTKTAYIHVFVPPVANFTAPVTYFCHPPAHVSFTGAPSGTAPFSYSWNFGDGGPGSTLANPTHDYFATGSYTVRLTIVDANGCVDSASRVAYIIVDDLNAEFTFPSTACVNTLVTFPNTSSAHSTSSWNYGDGGSGTSETGLHSYSTPGTYTVRLIVCNGTCCDTVYHSITILPAAVASFTMTPAQPCPAPQLITFTATTPPGCTVNWIYGDGGTGTGGTTTHNYPFNGCYNVKMIVTNASGCIDTFSQNFCIYDMVLDIIASDTAGCTPLTVNFNSTLMTHIPGPPMSAYPYAISTYSWDFGDGSPVSGSPTPVHTYTAPGTYTVTLNIITANGCTATATQIILVSNPPVISVVGFPTHACYHNNQVNYVVTVISGPADDFEWAFGDGTTLSGSATTISHHYVLPGLFSLTVTPYYRGCAGPTIVLPNYILIDSPMSIISSRILCSPYQRVVFGDSSLGDDTHLWIFGDGSPTSTLDNPVHDYPLAAIYTATLTTYNAASGCRDTAQVTLDLHHPIVTFTTPDTAICRDDVILFTSTVTGGFATSYEWHSSGRSGDSSSATYLDTFYTRGIFSITLTITDQNGCINTAIRPNYIHVAKPIANFTAVPPNGCWPLTTTFTNTSTDIPGTSFVNFEWAFGDSYTATTTSTSIAHTFTAVGTFTTQLIVTDDVGCKDTASLPLVTVWKPAAAFTQSTTHPCVNSTMTFTNTSGAMSSYYWWFGDGGTSTVANPTHAYAAVGTYTVKLAVTDSHGCSDTVTHVNLIDVTRPHAEFIMDDSVSICPPITVHFTNLSTGGTSNYWLLGDGSTSTSTNPVNLYITSGYDTVKLIVTNAYGCRDTARGHVTIFGYAGSFTYTPDSGCVPLTVTFLANTSNVPSIVWDFADGVTSAVSMTNTITHTYLIPGAYLPKLILSDNTGCQNSSLGIDTIKVDGVFPGFTTNPNPVCLGETINLVDTSRSFWSTITGWSWTYDGTSSIIASPSVTYTAVGTYPVILQVTDGWGCTATVNHDVTVFLPPTITVSPDTIICLGDAATLYGYGGVSYTWSGAGTMSCTSCNPTHVSPIVITQYTVTGTDANGCTNWDTTSVFLKTETVSRAWNDTAICLGKFAQLFDTGGTKYTWFPSLGLTSANVSSPLASPPYTTKYMAVAQLASCQPDTNYVTVTIYPLPTVDAGPDQRLLAGSTAQLEAHGSLINQYLWTPQFALSCDTCYNPVASMSVSTTYFIKVTTIHGCESIDSVRILLFCDNSQMFIPNSFTPNGDGQNDVFYPRGQGVSIIKSFRIYNRWGEVLFERAGIHLNDASNAWDGTYNGSTPKPDVYVWVIDAICETGEPLFLKGDITIIR